MPKHRGSAPNPAGTSNQGSAPRLAREQTPPGPRFLSAASRRPAATLEAADKRVGDNRQHPAGYGSHFDKGCHGRASAMSLSLDWKNNNPTELLWRTWTPALPTSEHAGEHTPPDFVFRRPFLLCFSSRGSAARRRNDSKLRFDGPLTRMS